MKLSLALALLVILGGSQNLHGGVLNITVKDAHGAPVADAVVYAKRNGTPPARAPKQALIDQQDKQFIPYVTAIQVGTSIVFPNKDNIRHHVYSLSPAKKFELPLYAGVPAAPVTFDKEGFVTLGCNIHDWMIAYVAVLPTPFFQVTGNDGHALLNGLPPGHYTVEAWQPSLKGKPDQLAREVDLTASRTESLVFVLDLKPNFQAKRAPDFSTGGYP